MVFYIRDGPENVELTGRRACDTIKWTMYMVRSLKTVYKIQRKNCARLVTKPGVMRLYTVGALIQGE